MNKFNLSSKRLLTIFVLLVLITNIFLICADDLVPIQRPGSTSGSTGTTTPSTPDSSSTQPTNPTNENPLSVPNSAKEPEKVGNKVLQKPDGKPGNPKDVTLKGGTVTPEKYEDGKQKGGKVTVGGKGEVDGKKDVDLGTSGDVKVKGNEVKNAAAGSNIKFSEKGKIESEKIIGAEPKDGKGTEVIVDGKDRKVTLKDIPKDSTLTKEPGVDYTLTMPKEGGKIPMPTVEKKKPEEEDKEGYNPNFRIVSEQAYSQIPDELVKKAGFASGLSFKTSQGGALIFNSDGTWRTQGTVDFVTSDGKPLFTSTSLGEFTDKNGKTISYSNANKESYLFFGVSNAETPEAKALIKSGISGTIFDNKYLSTFSTNDKFGDIVKLGTKNPYTGYESEIIASGNSGISVQNIKGRNEVQFIGKGGIFSAGDGYTFRYDGTASSGDLSIKKSEGIGDIFQGIESFKATEGSSARLIALDSKGNVPSNGIYLDTEYKDGKLGFQSFNNPGNTQPDTLDPSRITGNQPVPPSAVPVTPPKLDNNAIQDPPDYNKLWNSEETSYRTKNFVVQGHGARAYAAALEYYRYKNAMEWTGKALPDWSQPAVVTIHTNPRLGAGGATTFMFDKGEVYGWRMTIQGSAERLLDSVIPHEVEHMVTATQFRQPVPRWADEGMATSIEHSVEIAKHDRMLNQFLRTDRGIAFNKMFAMTEYPPDVMPLYAQGQSVTRFLLQQDGGGTVAKQNFYNFVGEGMRTNDWNSAVSKYYKFKDLGELQNSWVRSLMAKIITIFYKILR